MILTRQISFETNGNSEILNITSEVQKIISSGKMKEGSALIFVTGSTAAITTIEYEPGLIQDTQELFDKLIPQNKSYKHNTLNHDTNAHSHLRSTVLTPTLTVPFADKKLFLGTWQQIVLIDFDDRPRTREVIVQLSGE